jgi:hypothetical protein
VKKTLALLFALVMVFSLFACSAQEAAEEATEAVAEATEEPAEEPAATEEATEEPAEEATAEEPAAAEGVQRIIVWNNAIEGLTPSDQPAMTATAFGLLDSGSLRQVRYSGQRRLQVIGSDGYTGEETLSDILQKYLTLERRQAPVVVGDATGPDWAVGKLPTSTSAPTRS